MKGVSPVIATVLMVAVAIAAAVVAYSWFMSMQASVQAEASRGAGTVGKERFILEAVKCDSDTNILTVSLRNIGDEQLDGNFTIEVVDAATGVSKGFAVKSVSSLQPGNATNIDINLAADLNGYTYTGCADSDFPSRITVKVTSPGGSTNSKQERIK